MRLSDGVDWLDYRYILIHGRIFILALLEASLVDGVFSSYTTALSSIYGR